MRSTITCSACGTVLGVPKSGMPTEGIICNWCGAVSRDEAKPATSEAPPPIPVAADPKGPALAKPELHKWADDEDDDGQAYRLPQEEIKTRKCEACGKEVDIKAVVCVHCGYDARTKEKAERTFAPIDKEWESGWPFPRRIAAFLGLQGLNVLCAILVVVLEGSGAVSICTFVTAVVLQAFLLGTYDRVRIRRNKKGQTEVVLTWRVAFIPLAPKKINWREHEGVAFGHYDPTGIVDWWIFLVLLPMLILPAILWWWFVIRSERYFAALTRDQGYPETYLYRGMNEAQAKEISQIATDATTLPLTTPLKH